MEANRNRAQVHRLPTEDKSQIHKDKRSHIDSIIFSKIQEIDSQKVLVPQHLYFTTDQEIKEGDWCYDKEADNGLTQCLRTADDSYWNKHCRKIIATTDPKLIADGVAEIEQSFVEEYCKAGGIDKVLVEVEDVGGFSLEHMPKWEPKTDSNNCIIIHPVEEKMYSKEEVDKLCREAFNAGGDYLGGRLVIDFDENALSEDEWIKENL